VVELLILKSGGQYIRIQNNRYGRGGLDKASVFPLNRAEEVAFHLAELKKSCFSDAAVYKLIIEEKPYDESGRRPEDPVCGGR